MTTSLARFRAFLIFISLLLVLSFPAAAQKNLLEGEERLISGKKMPKWVPEHKPDEILGISGKFASEKDARRDALLNARKQIIDLLGVQLEMRQKELIVESSGDVQDNIIGTSVEKTSQTEAISRALISVRAKKYYTEKYATKHLGEIQYFYIAYVLVPFSKKEHDKIVKTAIKEYQAEFSSNIKLLDFVNAENLAEAMARIQLLKKLCNNARAIAGMRPEFNALIDTWENRLAQIQSSIVNKIKIVPLNDFPKPAKNGQLDSPIELQAQWDGKPVQGLTLDFFGNEKKITTIRTDGDGKIALSWPYPVFGVATLKIFASGDDDQNMVLFTHAIEFSPVVLIAIVEYNADYTRKEDIIASHLGRVLNQNNIPTLNTNALSELKIEAVFRGNYRYLDGLRESFGYALVGKVSVAALKESTFMQGLFQAKATCSLKLIDMVTKKEIWTRSTDSGYKIGSAPNEAERNAKIDLSKKIAQSLNTFLAEQ